MTAPGAGSAVGWAVVWAWVFAKADPGLFTCAFSGAILFMLWSPEPSWLRKIVYMLAGTNLGYVYGPLLELAPWTPAWDSRFYALLVSSMGILIINKVFDFVGQHSLVDLIEKIKGVKK